jgi:hypothetical protein
LFNWDRKNRRNRAAEGRHSRRGRFADGGAATAAIHEFWQRWPKAFEADKESFAIHLLPRQPRSDFGTDLPFWLMYPFVDGKYRFKWGMSFTTRVTFDFAGETAVDQLHADANMPVVAVLPAGWYASSKALGNVAIPKGIEIRP